MTKYLNHASNILQIQKSSFYSYLTFNKDIFNDNYSVYDKNARTKLHRCFLISDT